MMKAPIAAGLAVCTAAIVLLWTRRASIKRLSRASFWSLFATSLLAGIALSYAPWPIEFDVALPTPAKARLFGFPVVMGVRYAVAGVGVLEPAFGVFAWLGNAACAGALLLPTAALFARRVSS